MRFNASLKISAMKSKNISGDVLENTEAALDVVIAVAPLVPVPILTDILSAVKVIVNEAKVSINLNSFLFPQSIDVFRRKCARTR